MNKVLQYVVIVFFLAPWVRAVEPTFADLAVFCAKGYFNNHFDSGSRLEDYVSFLNEHGVCISLFDLMDSDVVVGKEDFAQVIGQSKLLLLGEAVFDGGEICLPKEITSWVDYCVLNDVYFEDIWLRFVRSVGNGPYSEVESFFANGR
jgi:hypothetical protein